MSSDPAKWANRSPGDLDDILPEIFTGDVEKAVACSLKASSAWAGLSLEERENALRHCQEKIRGNKELHAKNIARETGKPLREALGEIDAVIAKFDLTFQDAKEWIADRHVEGGPHPALIRYRPRGVAAVIAPFNFPLHLGHGATVAYLLSGNTVIFKPSPMAAVTAEKYAKDMQSGLPEGVFQILQGWGETGHRLCVHPKVRAVCFTGSAAVGRILARELADDFSKSLALELGGKNAVIVCEDANIEKAAIAASDGFCLTAGQRCNATNRLLVHADRVDEFVAELIRKVGRYTPGYPENPDTMLGALINEKAMERYKYLTGLNAGTWLLAGKVPEKVDGRKGHYVHPAVVLSDGGDEAINSPLYQEEAFAPIAMIVPFRDEAHALHLHEATSYGLSASLFTECRETFERIGRNFQVGNLYWNLPTTFSPSTLPFGGWGDSGNGKPGGRGFIRFTVQEQAVQFGS